MDHIRPLRRGGAPYDPDNLQVLCRACHIEKTRVENRRPRTDQEAQWDALVKAMIGDGPP